MVTIPVKKKKYEESSQNKKRNNQSFVSLPDDIILNCLARISRSYYPKLSLVCKTFRYLIGSHALNVTRFHLKPQETSVHVCLQFPDSHRPSLFALWIKPGQILTNQLKTKKRSTGDSQLVQITSPPSPYLPLYYVSVGSEWYGLGQSDARSTSLWVLNKDSNFWCETYNMTVAREKALACAFDGKLYVMVGCTADENFGEVFDPKTQTWEPLPDLAPSYAFLHLEK